jgi:hypothetical protein
VRSSHMTATRSALGILVVRKQDEVVDQRRCRVGAYNQSLHARFMAVHHKTDRVTWLNHKTKTGGLAGRDGIWAR